jgi:hypothetical protein
VTSVRPYVAAPDRARVVQLASQPTLIAGAILAIVGLVVLRLYAMHPGVLYPDGYQYLLMARGIREHLVPVTALGPRGDVLAPNADAAAKPLFPALVALIESVGVSPLHAARFVAAIGGAAVAPLAGLLALRLTGARSAALVAFVLCLASPTLGFWLGFPGPEGLALALALAAALASLCRRPIVGGVLAGLAVTARPEFLILAIAAAFAACASVRTRRDSAAASTAGLATIAIVIGVLRPPFASATLASLPAIIALGCAAGVVLLVVERASARAAIGLAIGFMALFVVAVARGSGWQSAARRDWPLLALAVIGLGVALNQKDARTRALRLLTLVAAIALAYWWKNPGSERYVAILLPAFAVLSGLGAGRMRPIALAGAAALALVGAVTASTPSVGSDAFVGIATKLEHAPPGPLVTAAPDAYGVLLPDRAVRVMRPGATGLVLVDGAARAYEPELGVRGRLVERLASGPGFLRPDGTVDHAPALIYRGTVTDRAD